MYQLDYQALFTKSPVIQDRTEIALGLLSGFRRQLLNERETAEVPDIFTWFDAVFDIPRAPFQSEILDVIVNSDERFILILAPPGHRKTTCGAAAIAYLLGRKLFPNCVIASYEVSYASKIMMQICDILRSPASERLLGQVIPPAPEFDPRIKKWTAEERYFLGTSYYSKDPTLKAIGQKSGGIGTRTGLLLVDDLVTIANSATPTLRENVWQWFTGALLPRLEPDAKVIVIGACFFEDDAYARIKAMSQEKGGNWKVLEYAASPDKPLWPERFSSEDLLRAYQNDPVLFPAQYLQRPLRSAHGLLKKEWLQYYIPDSVSLQGKAFFAGVDPCKSSKGGDKFVMAIGAYDGKTTYLVEMVSGHYSISQQLEIVKEMAKRYSVALINVEEDMALSELLKTETDFRINVSPSLISKELRLKNLGSLALKGKFLIPGKVAEEGVLVPTDEFQEFYKEWSAFPADHDDFLDACEKLLEAVSIGVEPATAISASGPRRRKANSRLLFHDEVMI